MALTSLRYAPTMESGIFSLSREDSQDTIEKVQAFVESGKPEDFEGCTKEQLKQIAEKCGIKLKSSKVAGMKDEILRQLRAKNEVAEQGARKGARSGKEDDGQEEVRSQGSCRSSRDSHRSRSSWNESLERFQLELQMQREERQFQLEKLKSELQMKNEAEKEKRDNQTGGRERKRENQNKKTGLTPEAYRKRFREMVKAPASTFNETARDRERLFQRWMEAAGVGSYADLKQLMIMEKFLEMTYPETKFKIQEAGMRERVATCTVRLKSDYSSAEMMLGVCPDIPVPGVQLILGNDLCGYWVLPKLMAKAVPEVCQKDHGTDGTPDGRDLMDIPEDESEDRQAIEYPASVVTRAEVADEEDTGEDVSVSTPPKEDIDVYAVPHLICQELTHLTGSVKKNDSQEEEVRRHSMCRGMLTSTLEEVEQQVRSSAVECNTVLEETLRERGRVEWDKMELCSRVKREEMMMQAWRSGGKSKIRWKSKRIKSRINEETKEGIVGEDEEAKCDDKRHKYDDGKWKREDDRVRYVDETEV
ncbi:inner centromere protein-like [Procambarus clarkii]|uniref:inner centromere protein-like n=1 Tax=Procambarus clarkii TaxID=6728 RepID=UPI003741ECD8